MMDAHQINPQKAGEAVKAFALAVTPPKPEKAQTSTAGGASGKGGRGFRFGQKGGRA